MSHLQQLTTRGWSWSLGYSHDYLGYVAKAWRPWEKPYKTPEGVTLFLHNVSAIADMREVDCNAKP